MDSLPPLNSLRAFEAAARHLSFNSAAAELHVTPSAISHAVKSLEADLETDLFRRQSRGVQLTPEGQIFLVPVREALLQLRAPVLFCFSLMACHSSSWLGASLRVGEIISLKIHLR